ncbi:glycosyltransferase family 2 protein [bacterium]|nr:glycosyltransferase family 2 protein [bacterium]
MIDLSVVVITLNEQARLGRCLSSLPSGVEIIVLDSGSVDGTLEVARSFGARTAIRVFDNYASQKNAALAMASRRWTLSLDADEVVTPELARDLAHFTGAVPTETGGQAFRLNRRLCFMGRAMRFGKTADKPVRLFRTGCGEFHSAIHESFEPRNGRARIAGFSPASFIIHTSYDDLTDYFDKFNRYTSRMAKVRSSRSLGPLAFMAHVLRPFSEFVSRYFLRLGFLDGYPGYCYALLSSLYAFVKYAKAFEQKNPV